jgi:hypothetical protein
MSKIKLVFMLSLGLIIFPCAIVFAFSVPKLSLEEKVAKSSLVFIGTIKESDYKDARRKSYESVALVRVDQVLKGSVSGDVQLLYSEGIAESALDCCIDGGTYLFFVSANERGLMRSVNGPNGIYQINPAPTSGAVN